MSDRIYDVRHDMDSDHVLHIEREDGGQRIALIVIDGEDTATLKVDREGAKKIHLALARFLRSR